MISEKIEMSNIIKIKYPNEKLCAELVLKINESYNRGDIFMQIGDIRIPFIITRFEEKWSAKGIRKITLKIENLW